MMLLYGEDVGNYHLLKIQIEKIMNKLLSTFKNQVFIPCSLVLENYNNEKEGKAYEACQFELNGKKIISRSAKKTPKKIGQFVTFWKRNSRGITCPFSDNDEVDFYMVNVQSEHRVGQFVFPKSELLKRGIISTSLKEGKRGFRVYPRWDIPQNKQSRATQAWQLNYFYELESTLDLELLNHLFAEFY